MLDLHQKSTGNAQRTTKMTNLCVPENNYFITQTPHNSDWKKTDTNLSVIIQNRFSNAEMIIDDAIRQDELQYSTLLQQTRFCGCHKTVQKSC